MKGVRRHTVVGYTAVCLVVAVPAGAARLRCPPDSVKVGDACIDLYEESVWQIPPSSTALVKRVESGRATLSDLTSGGATQLSLPTTCTPFFPASFPKDGNWRPVPGSSPPSPGRGRWLPERRHLRQPPGRARSWRLLGRRDARRGLRADVRLRSADFELCPRVPVRPLVVDDDGGSRAKSACLCSLTRPIGDHTNGRPVIGIARAESCRRRSDATVALLQQHRSGGAS